jgi:magnesium transporter
VVPLYRLVLVDPARPVREFMTPDPVRVVGTDDQHEVVEVFRERHFLAVPVVDLEGRLIGVVTADDVSDILEQEATEDMYRMAGVGVTERATSPMLQSARRRVPWLAFNMVWSLGSAFIISVFQGTIKQAAVLAVFIPVITGQAGNAGIQTATIVIRSLALGDVTTKDTLSVLFREWGVGLIKGTIFGVALFLIAWIWKGNVVLGVIAGVALLANIAIVASTKGVILPMTLRKLGIDPATIAGVFDTMFSDLMGNLIYLGLATILIHYLI